MDSSQETAKQQQQDVVACCPGVCAVVDSGCGEVWRRDACSGKWSHVSRVEGFKG